VEKALSIKHVMASSNKHLQRFLLFQNDSTSVLPLYLITSACTWKLIGEICNDPVAVKLASPVAAYVYGAMRFN